MAQPHPRTISGDQYDGHPLEDPPETTAVHSEPAEPTIYSTPSRTTAEPMGGIELRNETPVVDREPNRLDRLASDFSGILDQFDIEHVYGTDDVAILTGRARSTEDIDVLIERVDAETAEELTSTFTANGFWGLAMPLGSMFEMLTRVT